MKRLLLTLVLAAFAVGAMAQASGSANNSTIQTISVSSKGSDVRDVLSDLFAQTKKNFVIEPNVHFALFLSLNDMEFEEALALICKTASLKYQLQNGIYFISKKKIVPAAQPAPVVASESAERKPEGKLSQTVLKKRVSAKDTRIDIRDFFKDLSTQSAVPIEVDSKVPGYKLDIVLRNTSLKYALDTVCKAAGLSYKFTDNLSILVAQAEDKTENKVTVHLDTIPPTPPGN